MKRERRMATPHYRGSANDERAFVIALTFIVGAMCGAAITLGVMG